jgi:hypothetical protein
MHARHWPTAACCAALLWACSSTSGSGAAVGDAGRGGGGGAADCGIASCAVGFSIDRATCSCRADGAGGGGGAGNASGGGASGSGGSGGISDCTSVGCAQGYTLSADGCSCIKTDPGTPPPLPTQGSWGPVSTTGAPSGRTGHTVVWTGSEYIVWGGTAIDPNGTGAGAALSDGARYDPSSDGWTPVSTIGAPSGREGHKAAWTGQQMVVFGQSVDVFPTQPMEGALYDPVTDTWTPISPVGAPAERAYYDVIAVDGKVVVWGGWSQPGSGTTEYPDPSGGVYDPSTSTWTPIATAGAPRYDGGHVTLPVAGAFVTYGSPAHYTLAESSQLIAARYDLATQIWTTLDQLPGASGSQTFQATVIDGDSLLSVTATKDGGQCLLHQIGIAPGSTFTTEVVADAPGGGAQCLTVSTLAPHVTAGHVVATDSARLLALSDRTLADMAVMPKDALGAEVTPSGYLVSSWSGGADATDGAQLFVFGGLIQASEPPYNCPPGAPCAAPAEVSLAAGGALFSP